MQTQEYIVFSCPKCNKRRKTLSENFSKEVLCSCGYRFIIASAKDIAFEEIRKPAETMFSAVPKKIAASMPTKQEQEIYAAPGEIPPSRYELRLQRQAKEQPAITEMSRPESSSQQIQTSEPESVMEIIIGIDVFLVFFLWLSLGNMGYGEKIKFSEVCFPLSLYLIVPTLISYLAEEKTGHPLLWYFFSLLTPGLNLISLLVLLLLPKKTYK